MSPQEIHKMETLKEDDNPVILKYYLNDEVSQLGNNADCWIMKY